MGEDAEQGVGGQAATALQHHQYHGQGQAADGDGQGRTDIQQEAHSDPEQGGMGQGVAEIGHAPPDHKGAEGTGDEGEGETGEQGIQQEISHACSGLHGHAGS